MWGKSPERRASGHRPRQSPLASCHLCAGASKRAAATAGGLYAHPMTPHVAIVEATSVPASSVTLADLERWIEALAATINADQALLPTFGRSADFAQPHIELCERGFAYVIVERGQELDRFETDAPIEILERTFVDIAGIMGSHWAARHRDPGEHDRRRTFAKQLDLLAALFPPWVERLVSELGDLFRDAGLDPEHAAGVVALAERPPEIRNPKGRRLYNATRKVQAHGERLGFRDDENVVAAAMTFPFGQKRKTALAMGAGGVTTMSHDPPTTHGVAARMPGGQHFLAVTNRRLLATTVSSVSTNPKALVAAWSLEEVESIDATEGFMAASIHVVFRDGSEFRLDGARSSGAEELADVFG